MKPMTILTDDNREISAASALDQLHGSLAILKAVADPAAFNAQSEAAFAAKDIQLAAMYTLVRMLLVFDDQDYDIIVRKRP